MNGCRNTDARDFKLGSIRMTARLCLTFCVAVSAVVGLGSSATAQNNGDAGHNHRGSSGYHGQVGVGNYVGQNAAVYHNSLYSTAPRATYPRNRSVPNTHYYLPAVPAARQTPAWHDTTHRDYHPGSSRQHGNHYDYQPSHYDVHRTGLFHY